MWVSAVVEKERHGIHKSQKKARRYAEKSSNEKLRKISSSAITVFVLS